MYIKKLIVPLCLLLLGTSIRLYFPHQVKDMIAQFLKEKEQGECIDFTYWQERNPDVYAWIRIPDTKIDNPILQCEEDGYYLTHDIDQESNIYGAIYTEDRNGKTFTDTNTVVYGHNMTDDSMFGSLEKFLNKEYFNSHDTVIIFTPKETRRYQIIAAYEYPADHLLTAFDVQTPEGSDIYLQQIPRFVQIYGGLIREQEKLNAPLLTLSTCTANDTGMRCLIQAVLTECKTIQ